MAGQVRLSVLGPVLIEDAGGRLAPVPGALSRAFLVALVLARGSALTTEALIDDLWGDEPPRGARAALQTLVSRLRRATADGIVVSTGNGYRLGLDASAVDLARAAEAVASGGAAGAHAADAADPRAPAARAEGALRLWRGEPGADLDGPLAEALADRAAEVQGALRRRLADALLACDDAAGAVRLWTDEAEAHPFDETAVAGRMRSLAAAGRPAEAVAVFGSHRERLADELGADPSADLVRLNVEILRRNAASQNRTTVRRIGLRRAATALVGRDADVETVRRLVREQRLVTVLGPGGLGKTRLAQEVAAATDPAVAVVVLELASLTSGAEIVPALGALLGIAEVRSGRSLRDVVVADVHSRAVRVLDETPTLLLLDNCEHVVADVAALVADLLAEVPTLRILTTSRAPLAVPGEVVSPLPPLPVEADGAAVRLFTERARAARPGAVLPVDAVRRICTRLDGSPLAIELAAARVRGMSVDEIERRLDDRFALLRGGDRTAPERHRTLLAVIEWSWRLLDPAAQDLLTRLALFADGFSVDAVEAVAPHDGSDSALDGLAELVEQSLVQLTEREGEPARYRLLETVREFGAARLADRALADEVRRAMIVWGTAFALGHNVFLPGPDQRRLYGEVEREADNLVVLLRWALVEQDRSGVAAIAAALATFWTVRGIHTEVIAVAFDVVALLKTRDPEEGARVSTAVALTVCGASLAFSDLRSTAVAISALKRHRRRLGPTGERRVDAQAELLALLGRADEGAALLARLCDDPSPAVASFALALSVPIAGNAGEIDRAHRYALRAEELSLAAGDGWTAGTAAVGLVQLLSQMGRPREALAAAERARERLQWFGIDHVAEMGSSVGLAAAAVGDTTRARAAAADLDAPRSTGNRFDDDGTEFAVVAFAIRAESSRADGDLRGAVDEYDRAFDFVRDRRKRAAEWVLMVSAARLAAEAEACRIDGSARLDGTRAIEVARQSRVLALVSLRIDAWWMDLPVIGDALLGLASWGAASGRLDPGVVASLWGIAMRLSARQDLAVLDHGTLRRALGGTVGDHLLQTAEATSAGLSRAEVVREARALLESVRILRSGS